VLRLIKNQAPDIILDLGNYGYEHTPTEWRNMVETELNGSGIRYLGVVGRQEALTWGDYLPILTEMSDITCEGEYGDQMTCISNDIFMLLSGVGTSFALSGHASFVSTSISEATQPWKICAWHWNNYMYRVSEKSELDSLAIGFYDMCRDAGAMVATGFDENYARTKTMTDYGKYKFIGEPNIIQLGADKSFAFVAGLGGHDSDIYTAIHDDDWWATIYTENYYLKNSVSVQPQFDHGALFITFNVDNDVNKALGEFISVDGKVRDSFIITRD